MNNKDQPYLAALGCAVVAMAIPLLVVYGAIANGFVLVRLWEWFVIPTFEWASPLTLPYAIGLSLVIGYLTYHGTSTKSQRQEIRDDLVVALASDFLMISVRAGLALLTGWIVIQFI